MQLLLLLRRQTLAVHAWVRQSQLAQSRVLQMLTAPYHGSVGRVRTRTRHVAILPELLVDRHERLVQWHNAQGHGPLSFLALLAVPHLLLEHTGVPRLIGRLHSLRLGVLRVDRAHEWR